MVRLRVSLQGMNVSQCNVLKSDGNKRVCVCVCVCYIDACLDMKTHTGGVCSLGVILQYSGQAKVRHLTHQVAVDQDVAGSQVSVDVAQVRQVGHTGRNTTQQSDQLDDGELAIVPLQEGRKDKRKIGKKEVVRESFNGRSKKRDGIAAENMRVIIEEILIKIEKRVKIRE